MEETVHHRESCRSFLFLRQL